MKRFIVLHRPRYLKPCDPPEGFACQADDADHAEEQCWNAEPNSVPVWTFEGIDMEQALESYWNAT